MSSLSLPKSVMLGCLTAVLVWHALFVNDVQAFSSSSSSSYGESSSSDPEPSSSSSSDPASSSSIASSSSSFGASSSSSDGSSGSSTGPALPAVGSSSSSSSSSLGPVRIITATPTRIPAGPSGFRVSACGENLSSSVRAGLFLDAAGLTDPTQACSQYLCDPSAGKCSASFQLIGTGTNDCGGNRLGYFRFSVDDYNLADTAALPGQAIYLCSQRTISDPWEIVNTVQLSVFDSWMLLANPDAQTGFPTEFRVDGRYMIPGETQFLFIKTSAICASPPTDGNVDAGVLDLKDSSSQGVVTALFTTPADYKLCYKPDRLSFTWVDARVPDTVTVLRGDNVDCAASLWGEWSGCNSLCGSGEQLRTRTIEVMPANYGADCPTLFDSRPCDPELRACTREDCIMGPWSAWSECEKDPYICNTTHRGLGVRMRSRNQYVPLSAPACPVTQESQECDGPPCVDYGCQWNDWSLWGDCDAPCGAGVRNRTRTMAGTKPYYDCGSGSMSFKPCNLGSCGPGECEVSLWDASVSQCPVLCGGGMQIAARTIETHGDNCPPLERLQPCNENACATYEFSEWSAWSDCSLLCLAPDSPDFAGADLNPTQVRTRAIVSPVVGDLGVGTGVGTEEALFEIRSCVAPPACEAVDCAPMAWSAWASCEEPISGDVPVPCQCFLTTQRNRDIAHPQADGGFPCVIDPQEVPCDYSVPCWVNGNNDSCFPHFNGNASDPLPPGPAQPAQFVPDEEARSGALFILIVTLVLGILLAALGSVPTGGGSSSSPTSDGSVPSSPTNGTAPTTTTTFSAPPTSDSFSAAISKGLTEMEVSFAFWDYVGYGQFMTALGQLSVHYPAFYRTFAASAGFMAGFVYVPAFDNSAPEHSSVSASSQLNTPVRPNSGQGPAEFSAVIGISFQPSQLFLNLVYVFITVLAVVTALFAVLAAVQLRPCSPSCFIQDWRRKIGWWYRGALLRVGMVFYYAFAMAAFYQLALGEDSSVLALAAVLIGVYLVFLASFVIYKVRQKRNQAKLAEKRIKVKYGALYDDCTEANSLFFVHSFIFMLCSGLVVGVFYQYPTAQCILLLLTHVVFLLEMLIVKPYVSPFLAKVRLVVMGARVFNVLLSFAFLSYDASQANHSEEAAVIAKISLATHCVIILGFIVIFAVNLFKKVRANCCTNATASTSAKLNESDHASEGPPKDAGSLRIAGAMEETSSRSPSVSPKAGATHEQATQQPLSIELR